MNFPKDSAGRINVSLASQSVGLLHDPNNSFVGLQGQILEPHTNRPSSEAILVLLDRGDAWAFAQHVMAVAKEQNWNFAFSGDPSDRPGHPKKLN